MQIEAGAFGAFVAKEVHEARIHTVEKSGEPGHLLSDAAERQLRDALQLDRAIGREVLVPVHAAREAPVRPALGQEEIRFRALHGALLQRRLVVAQDEVVGDGIEVGAQRQARRDLPVVLDAAEAPEVSVLEELVDEGPVELAALVP